jgi:hypothetical protein
MYKKMLGKLLFQKYPVFRKKKYFLYQTKFSLHGFLSLLIRGGFLGEFQQEKTFSDQSSVGIQYPSHFLKYIQKPEGLFLTNLLPVLFGS